MSSPIVHIAPIARIVTGLRTGSKPNPTYDVFAIQRAVVKLRLIQSDGLPTAEEGVEFRIDTGADITQLSYERARLWNIEVSGKRGQFERTTSTRREEVWGYKGSIKVLFPDCDEHFELQCLFIEGLPEEVPALLGLHDTVDHLRLRFDKNQTQRRALRGRHLRAV